jgi:hypothetical protein
MKKLDVETIGKLLIVVGLAVAGLGGGLWVLARAGLPLGRLPGDIFIQRDGFTFYFPLATGILLSLALTIVVNLIFWWLRK